MAKIERRIIAIDEEKCNGCGLCATACHEGAIQMIDGKARLVSESYCDGLGDCLAPCPTGALSLITRPADEYDAEAVAAKMAQANPADGAASATRQTPGSTLPKSPPPPSASPTGCPGMMSMSLKMPVGQVRRHMQPASKTPLNTTASELMNWPVQLKLVPPSAPYLKGADILLAADCAAVAVPDFHEKFLKGKPVIISCPKLDDANPQIDKLAEIIMTARPASLTVVRMEVPCCGGLARVAQEAIWRSGLPVPLRTIIVGTDGMVKSNSVVTPRKNPGQGE